MAEVNSNSGSSFSLRQFWSATSLLTLTTSLRLIRNFKHYSSDSDHRADYQRIERILDYLSSVMHSYRGLLTQHLADGNSDTDQTDNWLPALIALREHIYQQWYYLHQQMLFCPTEQIASLIPYIDLQLEAWESKADQNNIIVGSQQFRELNQIRAHITNLWDDTDFSL